jgi:hypothetical protein
MVTTVGARTWSALLPTERETWAAPDGRLHLREVSQKPEFASEAQRAMWVAAGSPPLEPGHVSEESIKGPGFLDTSGLPTEPKTLRRAIEARKAPQFRDPPGEAETLVLIGDLLRETYLPPSFRAALYEVAAELPGVELLGEVRDPVGRTGLGVAFSGRETRHELIFDPETSALLAEREVITDPRAERTLGLPPGSEIESTSYLESGVVDSLRQPGPARSH